jgi:enamine deaminase RidA (YjgF/YER057c/UK114 family)
MTIQRFDSSQRMSETVIHNQTIYLSGQVPADESVDIKAQTLSTLQKIDALLNQQNLNIDSLLTVTIYIRDMKDFSAMNEVWDAWFSQRAVPARACVEAKMARPTLLVEMSCIAAISD